MNRRSLLGRLLGLCLLPLAPLRRPRRRLRPEQWPMTWRRSTDYIKWNGSSIRADYPRDGVAEISVDGVKYGIILDARYPGEYSIDVFGERLDYAAIGVMTNDLWSMRIDPLVGDQPYGVIPGGRVTVTVALDIPYQEYERRRFFSGTSFGRPKIHFSNVSDPHTWSFL